jgi:hypothetical protein
MKNRKKSQEADKYGQITFGEESKLLVDIIGQNAILDLMSEKNPNLITPINADWKKCIKGKYLITALPAFKVIVNNFLKR